MDSVLPLQQHATHAVHADAVIFLRHGRKQRGDAMAVHRLQCMKRHRAVFFRRSSKIGHLPTYAPHSWWVVYFTPTRNSRPSAGKPRTS